MNRLPTWEPRLAAYLAEARTRPHAYGRFDCMLFCAGAVKAVTGMDLARGHRGKYSSAAGSLRHLKKRGFDSPEAMLDSLLPERALMKARRGDVILDDEGIPGICIGADALMASEKGWVRLPRKHWRKAWGVGDF
jgi:hypothetical protein